jgi:AAA+ superfamily predicted ATPase
MHDCRSSLAIEHLLLRVQALNRALAAAVERQKAAVARLSQPELAALCVSGEEVELLLETVVDEQRNWDRGCPGSLTSEEEMEEKRLCALSLEQGVALPLNRLELNGFEEEALLLCVAPELDRRYERIYAFVHDDLNRRFASVELLSSLTAASLDERLARRHALSGYGRLRRYQILLPVGTAITELRQEFRLGAGVLEFLLGGEVDIPRLCRDSCEVKVTAETRRPAQMSRIEFEHLCEAVRDGQLKFVGIWGPTRNGAEDLVLALATELGRPLRRVLVPEAERSFEAAQAVSEQLKTASALDAVLWLNVNGLAQGARDAVQSTVAEEIAISAVPVLLTGDYPWRAQALLRSGVYCEVELKDPGRPGREEVWLRNLPELDGAEIEDLALHYRLANADVGSVSNLARAQARLAGNGVPAPLKNHVAAACSVVTRRTATRFAEPTAPKRSAEDLILPEALKKQVLEIAKFFRLQTRVDGEWGFARRAGAPGMKVLFTGDPGTGKTLSAEVIAGALGLSLYKVDLARIVSKWVGETEKNLDATFREAEETHSVLFFDEAEALFGRRGDVQSGTDRYANLEVSFLLQRLESSAGLVILASNLKDQIDSAFIRRFHVVVHFPRPGYEERVKMWQMAFPAAAPLETGLDVAALARLDLTGAAIMGAARTAALLAAGSGSHCITMTHIVHATARQFRREGRVVTPTDLGEYGTLLRNTL